MRTLQHNLTAPLQPAVDLLQRRRVHRHALALGAPPRRAATVAGDAYAGLVAHRLDQYGEAFAEQTARGRVRVDREEELAGLRRAALVARERAGVYARDRAGVAVDNLRGGYERARKDFDQLSEDVNTYVRDNPGRSILVAAGVGFLLGFLMRPRRRD